MALWDFSYKAVLVIDKFDIIVYLYTHNPKHEGRYMNYVDNSILEDHITNWINDCVVCTCLDRHKPKMPEPVGDAILKIIRGLSTRYNFAKYTYKDDMIGDAIVHVCTYIGSFNRNKGTAFNFISFAAYNSFSNRIKLEHRQSYYKNKNLQFLAEGSGVQNNNGGFNDPGLARMINDSKSSDFMEKILNYEEKHKPKPKIKIKPKKGLFRFIKDDGGESDGEET